VDVAKFAAKVDARLAALMPAAPEPKKESANADAPAQPVAPAAVAVPVFLDATVVESRIESERAEAYAFGAASRDAEVALIRAELDGAKAENATLKGSVDQLTATVKAERAAREAAEKRIAAMLPGAEYKPAATVDHYEAWNALPINSAERRQYYLDHQKDLQADPRFSGKGRR
jgi:hypothetical protein